LSRTLLIKHNVVFIGLAIEYSPLRRYC